MRSLHSLLKLVGSCLFVAAVLGAATSQAHDIPGKVTVIMYVKPEADRVLLLARAPLEAFAEVQIPVRGPGFLDMSKAQLTLHDAAQMYVGNGLRMFMDGIELPAPQLLNTHVALPSDKSFTTFDTALASTQGPQLAPDVDLYWRQAYFDVLFAFPLPANADVAKAKFSLDANVARLSMSTHTVLRYVTVAGGERIFDFVGYPGHIQLEPGWWHAFAQFVHLGFWHILDGVDHLLFLLCLAIPARSLRALIPVITAFTLAHSITLISSALGLIPTAPWFGPLIESLIAASVFYMACDNIFGAQLHRRWIVVYCFGLIHGFGFSFILAERMQFAGEHLISGLLAFNVGVELGQLAALLVAVPLLRALYSWAARANHGMTIATILLSALAAHSAWHWLTERLEQVQRYTWEWPAMDAAFFAASTRWLMLLLAAGGALWLMNEFLSRLGVNAKETTKIDLHR